MAVVIEKYSTDMLDATVSVLAEAFVTNPLHVSAFGKGQIDQNRLFFRIGLKQMFIGDAFIALDSGEVRGYAHFNTSPNCVSSPEQIQAAARTLFKPLGESVPRVIEWFCRWCQLDPKQPHVHLGPIGVSPEAQGHGVGTALMNRYIKHLKQERAAGYLETDRPENVQFYKKFGFVVQQEEQLIGTPTWYMWRPSNE